MFYTKYRPQKFSEISRPNEAADALAKQVVAHKTSHAYLFVGPRGTGKTSTARILAKALNCTSLDKNGDPCDECNACIAIKRGSYLDLIEIDAASNRGIDDIRELKNRVKLAPTAGNDKVYIIDEVHMLTNEAFNALLKTLEEPPKHTVFILCTTELHKVPETIKSRCQLFKFKRATVKQLVTKLEKIAEEEAITIEKSDLEKISRASMGGFRDAETMLQQISEGEVTVESMLNISSREKYIEFCDALHTKKVSEALKIINKVFDEGADINVWTGEFIRHLRDLLLLRSGSSAELLEIGDDLVSEVKAQSSQVGTEWLVECISTFINGQAQIKTSFIPQLPLELAVVRVCGMSDGIENINNVTGGPTPTPSGNTKPKPHTKDTKAPADPVVEDSVDANGSPESSEPTQKYDKIATGDLLNFDLSVVAEKWNEVIQKIETINKSILGLLKAVTPVALEGNFVIFEVGYLFHKERLEAPRNREVIEKVLYDIYDADLKVKCVISEVRPKKLQDMEVGVLTDFNVVTPSKEQVLSMLDGGLPL